MKFFERRCSEASWFFLGSMWFCSKEYTWMFFITFLLFSIAELVLFTLRNRAEIKKLDSEIKVMLDFIPPTNQADWGWADEIKVKKK